MTAAFRCSFACLAFLLMVLCVPSAWGQDIRPVTSTDTDDAPEAREPTPTDTAFEPLRADFATFYQTLRNMGGIKDENRPALEKMVARSQEFLDEHQEYAPAIAMRLQLAMWQKETDLVNSLFEQLVSLNPDQQEYADAWIRTAQRSEDPQAIERVFDKLSELQPENKDLILRRVETLRNATRYAEALALLDENEFDLAEYPNSAVLRSDLLYAENRFDEALAALNEIPDEVLIGSSLAASTARRDRPVREQYVELWTEEQEKRSTEAQQDDLPRVELLTDKGRIVIELFEDDAPNTVANFISLVESDFYASMPFHRVLPNFQAQVGDPSSRETAEPGTTDGPGYYILDELSDENYRRHFAGSVSMANKGPNTNGSQFFITHRPTDWLNGRHTVFGRVIEGLETARTIEQGDLLQFARVLRKRDHEYTPTTQNEATVPTAVPIPDLNILDAIDLGDLDVSGSGGDGE